MPNIKVEGLKNKKKINVKIYWINKSKSKIKNNKYFLKFLKIINKYNKFFLDVTVKCDWKEYYFKKFEANYWRWILKSSDPILIIVC